MSTRIQAGAGSPVVDPKDVSAFLASGPVNLSILREYYRQQLIDAISERPGSKALVLDRALEGQLNLICDFDYQKFLRTIEGIDSLHFLSDELYSTTTHLVYLVKPTIANMRLIAGHVITHKDADKPHVYTLLMAPRKTMLCERELEEQGVKDDIGRIGEFQLELIPVDGDLLSMEWDGAFRELYVDGDSSCLYSVARSLMKVQCAYGLIPVVKGKGNQSSRVWQLMQRMRRDWPIQTPTTANTGDGISALLLIDRTVDSLSPLLTPLTYEGLIDELFGIRYSILELLPDMLETRDGLGGGGARRKLALVSHDALYREIRSLGFHTLGKVLRKKAEHVQTVYDEKDKVTQHTHHTQPPHISSPSTHPHLHSSPFTSLRCVCQAATVKELHAYLQKFKSAHSEHFLLSTHFSIAEKIAERLKEHAFDERLEVERAMMEGHDTERCEEYIEAAIAKHVPLPTLMRLLGLMSLTTGIRSKKVEQWKRDVLQTYGYPTLFTLSNMERVGLLSSNKKSSAYSAVKKQLRLVHTDKEGGRAGNKGGGGAAPAGGEDISYVYEGVAPMIVRLIETAMRPGWKRMDEIMAMIPGNGFEYRQDGQQEMVPIGHTQAHAAMGGGGGGGRDSGGGLRGFFGKKKAQVGAADETAAAPAAQQAGGGGGGGAAGDGGEGAEGGEGAVMKKKPVVMAMFIGGCTYAEIAALRSLSERADHDFEYVIATTKVINGSGLCGSLQETVLDPDVEKVSATQHNTPDLHTPRCCTLLIVYVYVLPCAV